MQYQRIPLFKGATRLPTFFGVPRVVFLGTLLFSSSLFMFIHFYALGIFAILFSIEWMMCKHDDRVFRIIFLFIKTKFLGGLRYTEGQQRWQGISYSPGCYEKPNPRLPIFFKIKFFMKKYIRGEE